jgi:hypothetical protein
MSTLSDVQQKSLILGVLIIVSAIFLDLMMLNNNNGGKILLWSLASISFAVLVGYSFVINPSYTKGGFSRFSQLRKRNVGFKPRIITPAAIKKKTQFKGNCNYCDESSLLGFTCSYCNNFYCENHRLPEKHNCKGLHYR